ATARRALVTGVLWMVWNTTQYRSTSVSNSSSFARGASVSTSKRRRISLKPTGTSSETPSVPRRSTSPSAVTNADRRGTSSIVAAARNETPAQATSASSNMSPEQSSCPEPPAIGRSEEHTSELQSRQYLVCRLLLEKK